VGDERVTELLEQLETPGLDPEKTALIVEEINTIRGRPTHPGAVPNPSGGMVYTDETGAIAKPYRPLHVHTKDTRTSLPHEARAPFIPGVTQVLPEQTVEEQVATVRRDLAGRVQELEEMLDNPGLEETTRALVLSEIERLGQLVP